MGSTNSQGFESASTEVSCSKAGIVSWPCPPESLTTVPSFVMVSSHPSISQVRDQFPALQSGFAFLENAGGSQLPLCVIESMSDFMRNSYVQTTAGYPASHRATETALLAHQTCETLVGAGSSGSCILGASTTQLVVMLAEAYSQRLQPGDEIIISVANHEANAGPWARLERYGAVVKWWGVDPVSGKSNLDELESLLTSKTKIVAVPHVSNLLGTVLDIQKVAQIVHRSGAKVVVDGVAYAPHGLIDVSDWNVDYYVYSTYKVYGPHMGVLYGKLEALAELEGANHFFVKKSEIPRKFELGCLSYEGCAGIVALGDYLCFLAGSGSFDRKTMERAAGVMAGFEAPLTDHLTNYLMSKPGVRVIGETTSPRVPTVSFVSQKLSSPQIAGFINKHDIGIRYGHMYSYRLTEALGVDPETGFVRVSAVHYNTIEEINRLCDLLDECL